MSEPRGYTIVEAKRETGRIVVTFRIHGEIAGEAVDVTQAHGFPLDATDEFINQELSQVARTYFEDRERADAIAEREAVEAQADATIDQIKGTTTTV